MRVLAEGGAPLPSSPLKGQPAGTASLFLREQPPAGRVTLARPSASVPS